MQKMILDVDTGIDDALAIAYAVASPEIELLAVTVSYGNTPFGNAYRNTCELLKVLGVNIPVYGGAKAPLMRTAEFTGIFHGQDGLGETLGETSEHELTFVPATAACDYMIEQARRHGKELKIVTTGPLTNLALALTKEPRMAEMIGQAVVMGGAVSTPGNVDKFAEANIYVDPEAAEFVLSSDMPVTLVGLDVTRKTLLTYEDMERWRNKGTRAGRLFADFTEYYLNVYREYHPYLQGCALHDPLAVGVAKAPELVSTVPMFIKVDLEQDALGRTTEDLLRTSPNGPNTHVCMQVDAVKFMADFFRIVDGVLEGPSFQT